MKNSKTAKKLGYPGFFAVLLFRMFLAIIKSICHDFEQDYYYAQEI